MRVLKLLKVGSGRGELGRERGERKGKGEDLLQAAWCVYVNVWVHTSERVLCGEWVGASVSRPGLLCSALSRCASPLG